MSGSEKARRHQDWSARAESIAVTLDVPRLQEVGLARNRESYFLNISYPSLQAMKPISSREIYPVQSAGKAERQVALYVHIPFCRAECTYCHYDKEFAKPVSVVDKYLDSLNHELALYHSILKRIRAASVYIGGGTPSYLTPSQIRRLFQRVRQHIEITPKAQITFEMHPADACDELFQTLSDVGVNRISIGVESLDDSVLKNALRRHTSEEAVKAYEIGLSHEFKNINLDFIYGLRGQSIHSWKDTLTRIGELKPASFTAYYLRIKRGTPEYGLYHASPQDYPSEHDLLIMHIMTFEAAAEFGYSQEIVDWFIRDKRYFHEYQKLDWQLTDETELLGVGASSYSYVNGFQYYNVNEIGVYEESLDQGELPIWKGERLVTTEERMRRVLMLGLKCRVERQDFRRIYGIDPVSAFPDVMANLERLGVLEITEEAIFLTYKGRLFADEVGQQFYSDEVKSRMQSIDPALLSTTFPHVNPIKQDEMPGRSRR